MAFTERSAPTRTAILTAARKLLAQQGYEGTTIRAVAAEVGVDPSMVMRYYGNKAGLFSAAVDVDFYLEKVASTPKKGVGEALARHFVSRWEGELSDEVTTLLLRSAATNEEAAQRMRTIFATQVTEFVRDFTGGAADAADRAGLVSSQLLGLALTRYVIALPPVVAMKADTLVQSVAPVLQYYLTAQLGTTLRNRGGGNRATSQQARSSHSR